MGLRSFDPIIMTTIVADFEKKQMAADSKISYSNRSYMSDKMFRTENGTIFGVAGNVDEGIAFVNWYLGGRIGDKPEFDSSDESFEALLMNSEGLFHCTHHGIMSKVKNNSFAIGSGAEYALGAYRAIGDLRRSVEIACEMDSGSGGDVVLMDYYPIEKKRKKRSSVRREDADCVLPIETEQDKVAEK